MIFVYVGNTGPSVFGTLREYKTDGSVGPVDLSNANVSFQMRSNFGSTLVVDAPATIEDPQLGTVRYDWQPGDTTTAINSSPGLYQAWWHLDFGGGVEEDSPEFEVQFLDHAPRRSVGPCTDWCSTQDVAACFTDVAADACLTSSVRMASEMLYELSGHQFAGWCQSTIRPCGGGCFPGGTQILDRGHIVWTGFDWQSDGESCQCGGYLSQVKLPGVAQNVTRVLINGEVIDPSAYRLDPNNQLVRTDGAAWPECQNMAAADDGDGAFSVTYVHGYDPPELGKRAATELAHEFWLVCNGSACSLPVGVVELTRQGITVKRNADLWANGATGLPAVDSFIAAFNQKPGFLVMSPDVVTTSRRTL